MKDVQKFVERWQNKGDEKSDTQRFWSDLLQDVYGVERPSEMIRRMERYTVFFIFITSK